MGFELAPGVVTVGRLPAVFVEPLGAVVVADLHLGFEEEAAGQGMFVPRVQLGRAVEVLRGAVRETGAGWVIIDGDLKHSFSRLLRSEREEVRRLLGVLTEELGVRVTVVRGNHDNYLPLVLREYPGVEFVEELFVGGYLFLHGHRRPRDREGVKAVIIGHEHPSLRLRDRLGFIAKLPAFLSAPYPRLRSRLVVLPAIGQYQTGTTVSLSPDTYLSPILREEIPLGEIKPYVLAEELGVLEFPELGLLEDLLEEVAL